MRTYNFTSTLHKILGFQSAFKSTFNIPMLGAMSSPSAPISTIDPNINRTISYWFDGPDPMKKWFRGGVTVDEEIRAQFLPLVEQARDNQLTSWTEDPRGSLALIVLLDQFPRNLYRGSPSSYSSDSMALDVASKGIARGQHKEVTKLQMHAFYLPFMHAENLISQIAAVSFLESLVEKCEPDSEIQGLTRTALHFAERHRDCILRFGRFPSRNKALGRISTPEEIQHLEEHPMGF